VEASQHWLTSTIWDIAPVHALIPITTHPVLAAWPGGGQQIAYFEVCVKGGASVGVANSSDHGHIGWGGVG